MTRVSQPARWHVGRLNIAQETLDTWPEDRLACLWQMWAEGAFPARIAARINAEWPDLPHVTANDVANFTGNRKRRRGDPVPDRESRPDCWLYRPTEAAPDQDADRVVAVAPPRSSPVPVASPETLARWTPALLALMYRMVELRFLPSPIARACSARGGVRITAQHVNDFLRHRGVWIRRGHPVPSYQQNSRLWLNREPTADDLDVEAWLPVDRPASGPVLATEEPPSPPVRVDAYVDLAWQDIVMWGRQNGVRAEAPREFLSAVNRKRRAFALPGFRPSHSPATELRR